MEEIMNGEIDNEKEEIENNEKDNDKSEKNEKPIKKDKFVLVFLNFLCFLTSILFSWNGIAQEMQLLFSPITNYGLLSDVHVSNLTLLGFVASLIILSLFGSNKRNGRISVILYCLMSISCIILAHSGFPSMFYFLLGFQVPILFHQFLKIENIHQPLVIFLIFFLMLLGNALFFFYCFVNSMVDMQFMGEILFWVGISLAIFKACIYVYKEVFLK